MEHSLSNTKLPLELCHLVQNCSTLAAHGRQQLRPPNATLTLGMYANGYQPKSHPNINTKISLVDFDGLWFPCIVWFRA